jgi:hypothetical protein
MPNIAPNEEEPGLGLANEESNTSVAGPPGREAFSPGPGINNLHPVGTEAGNLAPGNGLAIDVKASNLTARP